MAGWEKQTNQVPKCLILAVGNLGLSWKRKTFFLLMSAGHLTHLLWTGCSCWMYKCVSIHYILSHIHNIAFIPLSSAFQIGCGDLSL